MSDTSNNENAGDGVDVGNTATPVAGAGGTTASSAPAPTDDLGDLPDGQAVFDRGYVEKVRGEARRYRDEAKAAKEQLATYDSVYGNYEAEDRDVWLDIARSWASDPRQAAAIMQQIATAVLGEGDEPGEPDAPNGPASGDGASDSPLTQEQVAELVRKEMATADYQRQQDTMVEDIYKSMREAGIEPKSRDGIAVLWTANNETDGDIAKAIQMFKTDRQKAVDEYVADRASGKRPTPAANGVPASAHTPIKNLDDARRAADAYIRAQIGE